MASHLVSLVARSNMDSWYVAWLADSRVLDVSYAGLTPLPSAMAKRNAFQVRNIPVNDRKGWALSTKRGIMGNLSPTI